jgi:hypothetical protein
LDIEKDNTSLIKLLCEYTLRMIAKKNPEIGDAAGLVKASQEFSFVSSDK